MAVVNWSEDYDSCQLIWRLWQLLIDLKTIMTVVNWSEHKNDSC
jgi:hypothetical protein